MSKRWIHMSRGKEGSSLKKLAAGSLTFVKAYSNGQANSAIDTLEQELEAEIERERKTVPNTRIARLRHKGGKILRSKQVLLMIVVLNVIDCALVLGELVLDLHHVKDKLTSSQTISSTFLQEMKSKYPENIAYSGIEHLEYVYHEILNAHICWDESNSTAASQVVCTISGPNVQPSATQGFDSSSQGPFHSTNVNERTKRFSDTFLRKILGRHFKERNERFVISRTKRSISSDQGGKLNSPQHRKEDKDQNSIEEKIAKTLHKCSIALVLVLLVETGMKIFCFGKQLCEQKLEVFDAFIVASSFIVDLIFLQGLSIYSIQEFVFILAFLLPWGVLRVVNSLVVAVRNHEHFRLKLIYTQKKKVETENKQIRHEKEKLNEQIDSLRRLCLIEGVDDWKIQQSLARQVMRPGKGIMGSFASLAMGALGARPNGSSIWNLLGTPKMKRGKSEEWEGKLGVGKEDTRSLRLTERLWTVSGTPDLKKMKKARSLTQQNTIESDPGGTPPTIRGRLKAIKRFLKRQETVSSYSSTETLDKHSKCSLDRLSSSENTTPVQSLDYGSGNDLDNAEDEFTRSSLSYDVINECAEDKSDTSLKQDADDDKDDDESVITEYNLAHVTNDQGSGNKGRPRNLSVRRKSSQSSNKSAGKGVHTNEVVVDIEHGNTAQAIISSPPNSESNDSPIVNDLSVNLPKVEAPESETLSLTSTENLTATPSHSLAEIQTDTSVGTIPTPSSHMAISRPEHTSAPSGNATFNSTEHMPPCDLTFSNSKQTSAPTDSTLAEFTSAPSSKLTLSSIEHTAAPSSEPALSRTEHTPTPSSDSTLFTAVDSFNVKPPSEPAHSRPKHTPTPSSESTLFTALDSSKIKPPSEPAVSKTEHTPTPSSESTLFTALDSSKAKPPSEPAFSRTEHTPTPSNESTCALYTALDSSIENINKVDVSLTNNIIDINSVPVHSHVMEISKI